MTERRLRVGEMNLVADTKSAAGADFARSKIPICVIQFISENVNPFSYLKPEGEANP